MKKKDIHARNWVWKECDIHAFLEFNPLTTDVPLI